MAVNLNIFSSFADLGKILSLDIVIFHIFVYRVIIQMNWERVWRLTLHSTSEYIPHALFCVWVIPLRMICSSSIHLSANFINSLYLIVALYCTV